MDVLPAGLGTVYDPQAKIPGSSSGLMPGWMAHKLSLAEVLLTDVLSLPDNSALVRLQWPRAHYFYKTESGSADTLLLAESLRQITLGVAHSVYHVPEDMKFVLAALEIRNHSLIPDFSRLKPTNVVARVSMDGIVRRRNGLSAFRIKVSFLVGSELFASGSLAAQIIPPAVYARLRLGSAAPANLAAPRPDAMSKELASGRPSQGDRVVEPLPSGQGWRLTPDPLHPLLFDHPLDHISGMFVVEAIRQVFLQLQDGRTGEPASIVVEYRKMIELSADCFLKIRGNENAKSGWLRFDFVQFGEIVAQANVSLGTGSEAMMPISTAALE